VGGIASFAVASRVKEKYSEDNIKLYFTDTLWESEVVYQFNREVSDKSELSLVTHSIRLNPIQLMFEQNSILRPLGTVGQQPKPLNTDVRIVIPDSHSPESRGEKTRLKALYVHNCCNYVIL